MIRPTLESDSAGLVEIARGTGVFKPIEIVALGEVLDDYHAVHRAEGHRAVTCEMDGQLIGFAYYAPTPMTDGTWHLFWIFVDKATHARGVGSALLKHVEDQIRSAGGRLLLIETASLPSYDLTRRFYLKHGYEPAARIADFYADGDDQVIFRKRLAR